MTTALQIQKQRTERICCSLDRPDRGRSEDRQLPTDFGIKQAFEHGYHFCLGCKRVTHLVEEQQDQGRMVCEFCGSHQVHWQPGIGEKK